MCVQYNLDFNTVDIWRAICESMPDAGLCWLEGCENSLAGYPSHALYCCPACRKKSPEYKAQQIIYNKTPKRIARQKEHDRKYKEDNREMLREKNRYNYARKNAKIQAMEEELIELRAKVEKLEALA